MPTTGEKPGKGTYKCNNCGTTVTLGDWGSGLAIQQKNL